MPAHPPPSAPAPGASRVRRSTLTMVVCWLGCMAVLFALMQKYLEPRQPRVQANGTLVVERGWDGHFRVPGSVNGQPVRFLVDTGASLIGVTESLAQRAGLHGGETVRFDTANGSRTGRVVRAEEVRVAHLAVRDLRVGIGLTSNSSADALLGQNFLRHFDLEMRGDRMLIHPRASH